MAMRGVPDRSQHQHSERSRAGTQGLLQLVGTLVCARHVSRSQERASPKCLARTYNELHNPRNSNIGWIKQDYRTRLKEEFPHLLRVI